MKRQEFPENLTEEQNEMLKISEQKDNDMHMRRKLS